MTRTPCISAYVTRCRSTSRSDTGSSRSIRHDDVVAASKDWSTFSSAHGVDLATLSTDPDLVASLRSIIMLDPPAHDRFRSLVSRVFTPKAMQAMEPLVRRVVGGYLDAVQDRDEFDVVGDLSGPFPVKIIAELLGVPSEDRQQIRHWLDAVLHREPGQMHPTQAGREASLACWAPTSSD